ncbi:hypothetical protein HG531_003931 [Fusarium graminearum]|nr:hypothetical protein HG531_003931 [Fusarium graminearum]
MTTRGLTSTLVIDSISSSFGNSGSGSGGLSNLEGGKFGRGVLSDLHELSRQSTLWVIGTIALDVNVEALRVVLSTVLGCSAMKSNDLVAEDVASSSQGSGDSCSPRVVVLDEIRSSPGSIFETGGIDLDPLECRNVSLGATSRTLGNICENRANVRVGPLRPLELDSTTSLDRHGSVARSSLNVAANVLGAVGGRGNEAVIKVFGGPSSDIGDLLA